MRTIPLRMCKREGKYKANEHKRKLNGRDCVRECGNGKNMKRTATLYAETYQNRVYSV